MANKINLTPKRISDSPHPETGKAFLWDESCPGLAVLATPKKKNFIFEGRFNGKTLRITIGPTKSWTVGDARNRAGEIRQQINSGIDPREEIKRRKEAEGKARLESQRKDVLVSTAWSEYLEDRKDNWSERHYLDHVKLGHAGGDKRKRSKQKTVPGVLYSFMALRLSEITPEYVSAWVTKESKTRKTQCRLGFSLLRAFINWCNEQPRYKDIAPTGAFSPRVKRNGNLHKTMAKKDCLEKEQLGAWFNAVSTYQNKVIAAYLQSVLITGGRREEILSLKWEDVDFKWNSLTIKDKVEGERIIPLTPYVASLLSRLPRRNEWVFSSPASANGRLQEPRIPHNKCLTVAGIEGLTIHGLRRSFGTLSEWVEAPVGIVYQIQGHKPSATAEKHYRIRPLDLLRKWHVKLEKWILEQAGLEQPTADEIKPVALKVIGG